MDRVKQFVSTTFKASLAKLGFRKSKHQDNAKRNPRPSWDGSQTFTSSTTPDCLKVEMSVSPAAESLFPRPGRKFSSELPLKPHTQRRLPSEIDGHAAVNGTSTCRALPDSAPLTQGSTGPHNHNSTPTSILPSAYDSGLDHTGRTPISASKKTSSKFYKNVGASQDVTKDAAPVLPPLAIVGRSSHPTSLLGHSPHKFLLPASTVDIVHLYSNTAADGISHDPLAEEIAWLRGAYLPSAGVTPGPSRAPLPHTTPGKTHISPARKFGTPSSKSTDAMGPVRQVHRRAASETPELYGWPIHKKDSNESARKYHEKYSYANSNLDLDSNIRTKQQHATRTRNHRRCLSPRRWQAVQPHLRQPGRYQSRVAQDSVSYPNLESALAEATTTRSSFPLTECLSKSNGTQSRVTQEEEGRAFTEQLQGQDMRWHSESVLSTRKRESRLSNEAVVALASEQMKRQAEFLRTAGSSRSDQVVHTPNTDGPTRGFNNRGTKGDPINLDIDSDDPEMVLATPRVPRRRTPASIEDVRVLNDDNSEIDTSEDAMLARRIHAAGLRAKQNGFSATRMKLSPTYENSECPECSIPNDGSKGRQRSVALVRDCVVCGEATPPAALPSLANCTHDPVTCAGCYSAWIASELETKGWRNIKCPGQCKVVLSHYEIQQYATKETFEQYDTYALRAAVGDDPNFRWCSAPGCLSGQIHVDGEQGNIFTCAACNYRVCTVHETPWHEGESCKEFAYRVSGKKEVDERAQEKASLETIGELSKKCPGTGCNFNIEKDGGCDHMTCSRCRHEFCWTCLADYNEVRRKGNLAHAETCKYHSSRIF